VLDMGVSSHNLWLTFKRERGKSFKSTLGGVLTQDLGK